MAKLFIEDTTLASIGTAIREKTGKSDLISPTQMPEEIRSIEAGGGSGLTEWSTDVEYNATYASPATANNSYNMFLDGKSFTINTSHSLCGLFYHSDELEDLSKVVINYGGKKNQPYFDSIFSGCGKLKKLPTLRIAEDAEYLNCYRYQSLFADCNSLRYIDDDLWQTLWSMKYTEAMGFYLANMFDDCWSLRQLPDMTVIDDIQTSQTNYTRNLYAQFAYRCFALDTIEYMPVSNHTSALTKNMFSYTFSNCKRVKDIIFATDDGAPKVANWSKQVIDLTEYVGYSGNLTDMISYNSGITADKEVKDDATYQALKNDPDWFATKIEYSRYNHTSAVNTINSLPDCSAGSDNTIKFNGASGSATDGGAISNLTEEEIAVATAKGWTVEIV